MALGVCAALFPVVPAHADGVDILAQSSGRSTKYSDSFEVGVQGQYYQYREPSFAKLQGPGGGIEGTYGAYFGNWFLRANGLFDYYNLDYSSNGSGSSNNISDYKVDMRGLFGYDFRLNRNVTIAPYTGLGYRILFDSQGTKITNVGAIGYNRRSQYLYAPVGATFAFHLGKWGFSTFGEYDYLIKGWQTSYLSDDGFDNNLSNTQNSGYGIRGNFLVKPPVDFFNFAIGPYARYWNIHNSDVQNLSQGGVVIGAGQEPANTTLEVGLEANITFQ